jgi:alkylated DNA repair dioxygenase AlkB
MNGITYRENFVAHPGPLFDRLVKEISWDESMVARKTASYGKAYNYSQIVYADNSFLPELKDVVEALKPVIGFEANNCLVNYYMDRTSKMGFHSDQTDILEMNTGITIISLGTTRILRFRAIHDPKLFLNYELTPGSLIYMTQEVQKEWQHAIPKTNTNEGRISLTFREIK